MTMIRSLLTMALAFGLLGPAAAQGLRVLEQNERPYELTLDQVRLPTVLGGTVTVHACDGCQTISPAVTAATRFFVNGRELPYVDFMAAVADVRKAAGRDQAVFVGVFVDGDAQRVNRIMVRRARG
jgi:hypothetical protein